MSDLREQDGGARSRKLWLTVATQVVIVVASLFVPAPLFPEVVMGLVTVCGIYVGGNAATRWVMARGGTTTTAPATAPATKPPPLPKAAKKAADEPPVEHG